MPSYHIQYGGVMSHWNHSLHHIVKITRNSERGNSTLSITHRHRSGDLHISKIQDGRHRHFESSYISGHYLGCKSPDFKFNDTSCANAYCGSEKGHVRKTNRLETKASSHQGQRIPAGYCHAHMLIYVSGVNYNVNSKYTNYFAQLCGRIFTFWNISTTN